MTSTASRSETDEDRWYFDAIDGDEAAEQLHKAGGEDGTFLVRKSTSSPGNFVLSLISEGAPCHLLISKHWDDAFFSLITQPKQIHHGLDTLILYYSERPVADPNGTLLCRPCIGEAPPAGTRLHGNSNLLHRAVNSNNALVVSELLKSGYRNKAAKNSEGHTALHIACIRNFTKIVEILLEAGVPVNVRDAEGLSPLQLACRHNHPDVIRILVTKGKCNIQMRHPTSGDVALHEAAFYGSSSCIEALLEHRAPAWPRSSQNLTPASLATKYQQPECLQILVKYRPSLPQIRLPEYYHGTLSRSDAEKLLRNHDRRDKEGGTFLLRRSSRNEKTYVISVANSDRVYHYVITEQEHCLFIDDGPFFRTLETLVDHYSFFADGIPCKLTYPLPPTTPLDESEFANIYKQTSKDGNFTAENDPLLQVRPCDKPKDTLTRNWSNSQLNVNIRNLQLDDNRTIVRSPHVPPNHPRAPFESIDMKSLRLDHTAPLGIGEFGSVLSGRWSMPSGVEVEVAVKTLKDADSVNTSNLYAEARVMMDLNHPYIIKFLGVCHGPPMALVQELAQKGCVLDVLINTPEEIDPEFHFKLWAAQIADGMKYLEQKHFVHRDLAARNLLLNTITLVKISDFGLSRALRADKDYYKATNGGRWPLKWYAPESINYGHFDHPSDVWSYGVTLWEIYTFGQTPYGNLSGQQVVTLLEKMERLPKPDVCPEGTYDLMLKCWHEKPKKRPSFRELSIIFRSSPDYINVKPYFKKT